MLGGESTLSGIYLDAWGGSRRRDPSGRLGHICRTDLCFLRKGGWLRVRFAAPLAVALALAKGVFALI